MFAILKTGGKQYKVTSGDVVKVEKLAANQGETVQFNDILMVSGEKTIIGSPLVAGAAVQAEVLDQIRDSKVINFVKRRRKHSSKRTKGHRQYLTLVKVTNILEKGGDKSGIAAAVNGSGFNPTSNVKIASPKKKVEVPAKAKKESLTKKPSSKTKEAVELVTDNKVSKKPKAVKKTASKVKKTSEDKTKASEKKSSKASVKSKQDK